MPHLVIEFSSNLEAHLSVKSLINKLHEVTAHIDDFPAAGLKTRGISRPYYVIADGHPDNCFVHVTLKIGHGRSSEVKARAGTLIFDELVDFLKPISARFPISISFELQELDEKLSYKAGNIREYIAKRRRATT